MRILYRNKIAYALQDIFHYPLMYIYAPMGYGKTTMVLEFMKYLKEIEPVYFSIHMESDAQWAWYKTIEKLRECIALPRWMQQFHEDEEFIQACIKELKEQVHTKVILILDDCEWEKQHTVIDMWAKIGSADIKDFHVLLISKEQPGELFYEMEVHGLCKIYGSELFLFDRDEVEELARINAIVIDEISLQQIYVRSNGWSSAIRALMKTYKDFGDIRFDDISKMMEHTIFWKLAPSLRKNLMKLSILKDFTMEQADFILKDKASCKEIYRLAKESFFMRIQKQNDRICIIISPILKEILKEHIQDFHIHLKQIYHRAADWERMHENMTMALYYYDQAEAYENIVCMLESMKDENCIDTAPHMMDTIYDHIPDTILLQHPYAWLRIISETCTDISLTKGLVKLEQFEQTLQEHSFPNASHLQGEVHLIRGFLGFNDIENMGQHFYKAYTLLYPHTSKITNPHMVINFESPHTLYLYHTTPGKLHELVTYIENQLPYFTSIASHLNAGMQESAKAEEALETGNIRLAMKHAWKGIYEASRYEIEYMVVTCYFTLCRCAIQLQEYKQLDMHVQLLKHMKETSKSPFLCNEIDCVLYYVYCKQSRLDLIPDWLKSGELKQSKLLDRNVYQYIVYGQILIKQKAFRQLENLTYHMEGIYEQPYHVFGLIYTYIYRMISLAQLQKPYIEVYEQLKALCEPDGIILPLQEEPLAILLLTQLPKDAWNEKLQRKEQRSHSSIQNQILYLLSQGYKRKEIAIMLEKNENTIHYHMKQLFKYYHVSTKEELIQKYKKACV